MERNFCNHFPSHPSPLQPVASGGQHCETNAAYFSWPTSTLMHGAAEDRANYFANLQKGVLPGRVGQLPAGQQATTLLDLMTIRAFHSKILRRFSLGTAIGYRIRKGVLTGIPAILVFVARKVHKKWLSHNQCLPSALEVNNISSLWLEVMRLKIILIYIYRLFHLSGFHVLHTWLKHHNGSKDTVILIYASFAISRDQGVYGVTWML